MDDERRIAQLQRTAYGSEASDAERDAALRELHESTTAATAAASTASATARADAGTAPAGPPGSANATGTAGAPTSTTAPTADGGPSQPTAGLASRPRHRTTVIAVATALLVGGAIGWQLGASTGGAPLAAPVAPAATPAASTEPRTQADYLASLEFAGDTEAAEVFSREASPSDEPPVPTRYDTGNGVPEYRLLATRSDGAAIFGSRDDVDLCLQVFSQVDPVTASSVGAGACTTNGRFPGEGLRVGYSATDSGGAGITVTWSADGTLAFDPVDE